MSNFLDQFVGLDFQTPEDAREWLDAHRHLSDREKRRVLEWVDRWETRLGQRHVEWLNERSAQLAEEHDRVTTTMEGGRRRTAEVERLLSTGRVSAAEGERELTRLSREHQECLKILVALRREIERWEADAEASPGDHLRAMQERFRAGAPRFGVQTLTLAVLRGEDGAS